MNQVEERPQRYMMKNFYSELEDMDCLINMETKPKKDNGPRMPEPSPSTSRGYAGDELGPFEIALREADNNLVKRLDRKNKRTVKNPQADDDDDEDYIEQVRVKKVSKKIKKIRKYSQLLSMRQVFRTNEVIQLISSRV